MEEKEIKERVAGGATLNRLDNDMCGLITGIYLNKDINLYTIFYEFGDREWELFVPRVYVEMGRVSAVGIMSFTDVYGEDLYIKFTGDRV